MTGSLLIYTGNLIYKNVVATCHYDFHDILNFITAEQSSDDEQSMSDIIQRSGDSVTYIKRSPPKPGKRLTGAGGLHLYKRKMRCKQCKGCLATDCGTCKYCRYGTGDVSSLGVGSVILSGQRGEARLA